MKRNLKCIFAMFLALTMGMTTASAKVVLTVKNPSTDQRHEVVAFDAKKVWQQLGVAEGSHLVVKDLYGLQVASQITHDQRLLVEAMVLPGGLAKFNVEAGNTGRQFVNYACGKLYAWRVDDITWENDKCSYRAYGPALQRTGEKAFGMDVWLKSNPYPDVERRYAVVYNGQRTADFLEQNGDKTTADSLRREVSLHLDHGTGLDCYNVGPSLGCGTPAIMLGDSIVMPYCFKNYRMLDNGPLLFTLELEYNTVKIGNQNVTEHRIISLAKGSYFNKMTVWYEGLEKPIDVAGGVVVHTDNPYDLKLESDYVAYTDPTDSPEKHNFQIYVATLFPEGADKTLYVKDPWHKKAGIMGNAVGVKHGVKNGERFNYYFGASWCQSGTPNQRVWYQQIRQFLDDLKQPLTTDVVTE